MRILILGGDGMLGHQLYKRLRSRHEVRATLRQDFAAYLDYALFDEASVYTGVDARRTESLAAVFDDFRPHVVVNGIGIVKQRPGAAESIPCIEINALLPHRLAALCRAASARLFHLSTDCVFSGRDGGYTEVSIPDAADLYGRSKLLGEVHGDHCITLRTSIVGPELRRKSGLLEWFLAQSGAVKGYTNAIFSGFTTLEMSRIIERLAVDHPRAHGLYHVSASPISKHDLLLLVKQKLGLKTDIVPDGELKCDRSLDSSRFRAEFAYAPPTWGAMIDELAAELGNTRT